MRINRTSIKAARKAAVKNPKVLRVLNEWALAQGFKVPVVDQPLVGANSNSPPGLQADIFDALTEQEMSHVSRPEGLDKIHRKGVTGKGVTVAVIDSGIAPHDAFGDRVVAFRDFTSGRTVKKRNLDTAGHGTHVAGIIAGGGDFAGGVAPEASLVGCRINTEQEAIKAIDWVIANKEKYSIDVLNLSLGVDAPANPHEDEFRKAAERAVDAGIIVVAAAGNECEGGNCSSTISSPGNSPQVITVGALDDRGTAKRSDDLIYAASSRGKTGGGKPDIVAEGVNVLGPLAKDSSFAKRLAHSANYVALAGSSQAAPMVAGTIALMLQVNPRIDQAEAKDILKRTADKLAKIPRSAQGSGRLDVEGAVGSAQRRADKAKAD